MGGVERGRDVKILSFSHCVPYEGIPHAGGEYYLRHVRALLQSGHEVTIVAPATASNIGVRAPAGTEVVLLAERTDAITRVADVTVKLFRYAVLPPRFARAVVADPRVVELVRAADLLEYQWVQASSLHRPLLRRAGVERPAVCIVHDVVVQSLQRWADQPGPSPARRLLRRVRVPIGRWDEGRQLRSVDLITTFSEKDRTLLERRGLLSEVIDPPLADDSSTAEGVARPAAAPRLLFVGAFNRLENVDAAEWLLQDIWPIVRQECPDARLALVGAEPSESMIRHAERDDRIEVTGYVADLGPVYDSSALAVVPLRLGAGVKFKVVTALLRGLPVITTSLGAEGVLGSRDGLFLAVTDDAPSFARAVIAHLQDPGRGAEIARGARARANARYGWSPFRERLDRLYGRTVPSTGDASAVVRARADAA